MAKPNTMVRSYHENDHRRGRPPGRSEAVAEELGFVPGVELELTAVDGHLEVAIPSRVRVEQGPHGVRFTAEASDRLSAVQVRSLMERGRR